MTSKSLCSKKTRSRTAYRWKKAIEWSGGDSATDHVLAGPNEAMRMSAKDFVANRIEHIHPDDLQR
jgi:carbohydrate-binding DOMON domain-containing protein